MRHPQTWLFSVTLNLTSNKTLYGLPLPFRTTVQTAKFSLAATSIKLMFTSPLIVSFRMSTVTPDIVTYLQAGHNSPSLTVCTQVCK